jgi:hypothetical protein
VVGLSEISQKKQIIKTVLFVLFLFALGYLRHLIISNWGAYNSNNATYSSENISWLRSIFKALNMPYSGKIKMAINAIFLLAFGGLGFWYFKKKKMGKSSVYFLITHFGLSILGVFSFLIAHQFHFQLLETNSRDLIVFLQAPYIFVLIYFTNYLSLDNTEL